MRWITLRNNSPNSYLNIETMNIICFDECIDDVDYINDYDGVEDYYADYYGNTDDNFLNS